ncbi:MAG: hypothetical protein GY943_02435 [Chloroflexi bacterium]|nr:hypothetical protein [Chloroflexota bacterium]
MNRIWILLGISVLLTGCVSSLEDEETAVSSSTNTADNTQPGKLIFIEIEDGEQFLSAYDLATQEINRLFTVPVNAWLSKVDITPESSQFILAYAPSPPEGQIQFGYTGLFVFTEDEAEPRELFQKENPEEVLYNPIWSMDDTAVYFSHIIPAENGINFTNMLERFEIESQQLLFIAEDAFWPRLSPDGSQLTYVTIDPADLSNALYIANADGSGAIQLLTEAAFQVVDVPMFSPDREWIYFTAAERTVSSQTWWEWVLGIETAVAHNIPSDWWRMPVNGGTPERLTEIDEVGIYGIFAEDGRSIYFASQTGLYQMNLDGSQVTQLVEVTAAPSLSWLPSNSGVED